MVKLDRQKNQKVPVQPSPLEFSKAMHRPPFRQGMKRDGVPDWRRIYGRLAIVDGNPREYVKPGHVFSVQWDSGRREWVIISEWNPRTPPGNVTTSRTLKQWAGQGVLTLRRAVTYEELTEMIRAAYPVFWIPPKEKFFAEFGLTYGEDGQITNPRGLREE